MTTGTLLKIRLDLKAALREGIDLWASGKFPEAFSHFQSIRHFFDETTPVYLRQYLCDLGLVYRALGQHERAIDEYEKALAIESVDDNDESDIAAVHANLAYALLYLNHPGEALAHLAQPEEYFRRTFQTILLGEVLETRASIELSLGRESALETAQEAYSLLHDCGDAQAAERASRTLQQAKEYFAA